MPKADKKVVSEYLQEKALKTLNSLPTHEQKVTFAKALLMSVKLDTSGNAVPKPCSPWLIQKETKFTFKLQSRFSIVLFKAGAEKFLKGYGAPVMTTFRKKHNVLTYEEKFSRKAPTIDSSGRLVCTYAEWLHQEEFFFQPLLPDEIMELIPSKETWTMPSGSSPDGNPPRVEG